MICYLVPFDTISKTNSIDIVMKNLKHTFLRNFVEKWSRHEHKHTVLKCNEALCYDGNWKIYRAKCSFDKIYSKVGHFGEVRVGCTESPLPMSYFCKIHQNAKLTFQFGDEYIELKPENIQVEKKSM